MKKFKPLQRGKHPNADLDKELLKKVNREYAFHIPVETRIDDYLDKAIVDEDVRYLIPFLKWCAENITKIDPFRYTLYTTIKTVLAEKLGVYLTDKEIKSMSYSEICKAYFGEEFCSKIKESDYVPYSFIIPQNSDERLLVLMTNDILITERWRRALRNVSLSRNTKVRLSVSESGDFEIEISDLLDDIEIRIPINKSEIEIEDSIYYDFIDPVIQQVITELVKFQKPKKSKEEK
jgi:hypothetical protein